VENFKVLWTLGGRRHVSVVSYDRASADQRMAELAKVATDVEKVSVPPGETVEVVQPRAGRVVQRRHTAVK
jgi:hypothetical protein